ncbi:hypothetical protein [uncultured Microbacterium sp.]|uniref:hypothetical protein n=1 Tax=uncultured Microbacterium sp. TaxID=191216 RepID=UPI0035CC094B
MRRLIVIAVLSGGLFLSGCAAAGEAPGADDSAPSAEAAPPAATDEVADAAEATAPEDVCTLVTAEEIGAALGAPVTIKTGPSGDCEFSQEDPRATSGMVGVIAGAGGGYDAYVEGIKGSILQPQIVEPPAIGSRALIGVGGSPYSETTLQAAGVAEAGGLLATVNLLGPGDPAVLLAQAEALLALITDAAS